MAKYDLKSNLYNAVSGFTKTKEVGSHINDVTLSRIHQNFASLNPLAKAELVYVYNAGVTSKDFGPFLTMAGNALSQIDHEFSAPKDDFTEKFEKATGKPLTNDSYAGADHYFTAKIQKSLHDKPNTFFELACAANEKQQVYEQTEKQNNYLSTMQKNLTKGKMEVRTVKEDGSEKVRHVGQIKYEDFRKSLGDKNVKVLENFGVDIGRFSNALQGIEAKNEGATQLADIKNFDLRNPKIIPHQTITGFNACALAAKQTYSVLAAPIIAAQLNPSAEGQLPNLQSDDLRNIPKHEAKAMADLLRIDPNVLGTKSLTDVYEYGKVLNSTLNEIFNARLNQGWNPESISAYKQTLVDRCVANGAFAASNLSEFLSQVSQVTYDPAVMDKNPPESSFGIVIRDKGGNFFPYRYREGKDDNRLQNTSYVKLEEGLILPMNGISPLTREEVTVHYPYSTKTQGEKEVFSIDFRNDKEFEAFKEGLIKLYPEHTGKIADLKEENAKDIILPLTPATMVLDIAAHQNRPEKAADNAKAHHNKYEFSLTRSSSIYLKAKAEMANMIHKYYPNFTVAGKEKEHVPTRDSDGEWRSSEPAPNPTADQSEKGNQTPETPATGKEKESEPAPNPTADQSENSDQTPEAPKTPEAGAPGETQATEETEGQGDAPAAGQEANASQMTAEQMEMLKTLANGTNVAPPDDLVQ